MGNCHIYFVIIISIFCEIGLIFFILTKIGYNLISNGVLMNNFNNWKITRNS